MAENGPEMSELMGLTIERASDDLRRGHPVVMRDGETFGLFVATDVINDAMIARINRPHHIVITGNRAQTLHMPWKGREALAVEIPDDWSVGDLRAMADPTLDLASPLRGPYTIVDDEDETLLNAALRLCRVARLLPSALYWPLDEGAAKALTKSIGLVNLPADQVLAHPLQQALHLKTVASARVPLEGAEDVRLLAFRADSGGPEHLALEIGQPDRKAPVLIRLHSECFTGDLLGSLKCDCGDQLKGSIKAIREAGGGVLLYLAQEGRGIGLVSKLKAYALQDQGFDTVDANVRLGFDVDERFFEPAAVMLKHMGITSIKLMTNNPDKVEGLERQNIHVVERVPHSFPPNTHNEFYLMTKKTRTGHML